MDFKESGRKGGLKGGKAKNKRKGTGSMTPERRREISALGHAAKKAKRDERLNGQPV